MQQRQYGSGISAARTIEMRHRIKKARWKIQLYQIKNQMPPQENPHQQTNRQKQPDPFLCCVPSFLFDLLLQQSPLLSAEK